MSSMEALPSNSLRTLASFRAVSTSSTATVIRYDLSQPLADTRPDERRKSTSFLSLFGRSRQPVISADIGSRRRRTLSSFTRFFHKLNPRNKPEKGHTIRQSIIQEYIAQLATPFHEIIEVPPVPNEPIVPVTGESRIPVRTEPSIPVASGRTEPSIAVIKKSLIPVLKRKQVDIQSSGTTQSTGFKNKSLIPVMKRKPVGIQTSKSKITHSAQKKALLESGDYLGVQGFNPRTGVPDKSEETTITPSTQTKDLSQRTINTLKAVEATLQQKEAEVKRQKRQGFKDMQNRTGAKRSAKQRWVAKPNAWVSVDRSSSSDQPATQSLPQVSLPIAPQAAPEALTEPTIQRESETNTIIHHYVADTTQRESADTIIHYDVEYTEEAERTSNHAHHGSPRASIGAIHHIADHIEADQEANHIEIGSKRALNNAVEAAEDDQPPNHLDIGSKRASDNSAETAEADQPPNHLEIGSRRASNNVAGHVEADQPPNHLEIGSKRASDNVAEHVKADENDFLEMPGQFGTYTTITTTTTIGGSDVARLGYEGGLGGITSFVLGLFAVVALYFKWRR